MTQVTAPAPVVAVYKEAVSAHLFKSNQDGKTRLKVEFVDGTKKDYDLDSWHIRLIERRTYKPLTVFNKYYSPAKPVDQAALIESKGIDAVVRETLADFIDDSVSKYKEQVFATRLWFRNTVGCQVDEKNVVNSSWVYRPNWSGKLSTTYSLTKAGNAKRSEVYRDINKLSDRYRDALVGKIVQVLTKYKATEFEPISVHVSSFGIEGMYNIGGGRVAEFRAIMAGGWNIQCFHYRYTVRVTK